MKAIKKQKVVGTPRPKRISRFSRLLNSEAYGDKIPICANTDCVMRKKAKCSGFEGCPGFKAR